MSSNSTNDNPETWDIYHILGLENGVDATITEIKRAYRSMALITHPDKHPNDPDAGAKFDRLKRAYEWIAVEENRKTFNARLRQQQERAEQRKQEDVVMQRMRERLEEGERAATVQQSAKRQRTKEDIAKQDTADYLEELERQGVFGPKAMGPTPPPTAPSSSTSSATSSSSAVSADDVAQQSGLVLRWSSTRHIDPRRISEEGIRERMSRYGEILHVIIKPTRHKAVVMFADPASAKEAIATIHLLDKTFDAEPLTAATASKDRTTGGTSRPSSPSISATTSSSTSIPTSSQSSFVEKKAAETKIPFATYETDTLARLLATRDLQQSQGNVKTRLGRLALALLEQRIAAASAASSASSGGVRVGPLGDATASSQSVSAEELVKEFCSTEDAGRKAAAVLGKRKGRDEGDAGGFQPILSPL